MIMGLIKILRFKTLGIDKKRLIIIIPVCEKYLYGHMRKLDVCSWRLSLTLAMPIHMIGH